MRKNIQFRRTKSLTILLLLLLVGNVFLVSIAYAQIQTITIDRAVQLFKDYLARLQNPDLTLHEVEEYQNNFYASHTEKSRIARFSSRRSDE